MSDHHEDELAISNPHTLFHRAYLSDGKGASSSHDSFTAGTSSLKAIAYSGSQPNHSPVSNRGVVDLLRSLNASFAGPSSSRTQSLSNSIDGLSSSQVDPHSRRATLDRYQTLSARKSTAAVASTSSIPLREPQALAPSTQYPISTLISPRRADAAGPLDRVLRRPIYRLGDDRSTTAYRADLDELEAWTEASLSSAVFKRPVYKKNPPVEQIRSATRYNLKSLTKNIEAHSREKARSSARCNGVSGNDGLLAVAVPEMARATRCNLIINEIFTSEQRRDEGTSSNAPSRSSPELNSTMDDITQRSSPNLDHNSHSFLEILTPHSSRILSSSSGHMSLEGRPDERLPFNDLPIPSSAQIPPLRDVPNRRSRSSEQTSQSNRDPVAGLTFAIDPHSALHRKPASGQPSKLNVTSSDSFHLFSPFREPSPDADYHASIPLPTSSNHLVHTPQNIPEKFALSEAILPEYREVPQEPLSSAPLSTLEPEVDIMNNHSVTDNQHPSNPVQAASEELIEIISPMVAEERYAISSRLHSPAHTLFDPILASSLSSSSGAYFTSKQEGTSTRQTPPQATAATYSDAQNEGIDIDENEFINFDPPEIDSAKNLPLFYPSSPPSPSSTPAPSETQSSAPPPALALVSDASLSQDPHQTPPSILTKPSPRPVEVELPAPELIACANWVDMDPLSEEETQDTSANHRKGSMPTVLDPKYLRPRYRDLWAPDGDNPYLQRAKREMVIGKLRSDLVIWYYDGHADTQNASDGEEVDEIEDEGDVESEDEDVEMEDPDTGMVFLSQASKDPGIPTTPTRKRNKKSNVSAPRTLITPSSNPKLPPTESLSTRRSNNRPSSRFIPPDASKNKRGRKRKRQGSLDGSDKIRDGLGDRVARWESILKTFIKGKKRFQRQELLDLKQVLQDIRVSAIYISPTSSLVEYVGVIADMEPEDIPMGDEVGLRMLAEELVQTWA